MRSRDFGFSFLTTMFFFGCAASTRDGDAARVEPATSDMRALGVEQTVTTFTGGARTVRFEGKSVEPLGEVRLTDAADKQSAHVRWKESELDLAWDNDELDVRVGDRQLHVERASGSASLPAAERALLEANIDAFVAVSAAAHLVGADCAWSGSRTMAAPSSVKSFAPIEGVCFNASCSGLSTGGAQTCAGDRARNACEGVYGSCNLGSSSCDVGWFWTTCTVSYCL
jgi:hypothetical protein